MSPVQEGSVVVYVIDNSGSLFHSFDAKEALFDAFGGLTGGVSSPNVRVAALKHGYGPPYLPPPAMETLKKNLFDFSLPADVPVDTLRAELTFKNATAWEQLYPGIMAAKEMIEVECPKDVDLVAKPWCQRKVIVALGDGDPGMSWTNTDYFPQPDAYLPTNLLSGLKKAEIQVDTLCVREWCKDEMYRCNLERFRLQLRGGYYDSVTQLQTKPLEPGIVFFERGCPPSTPNLLGREILAAISSHTGGVYHGVAD